MPQVVMLKERLGEDGSVWRYGLTYTASEPFAQSLVGSGEAYTPDGSISDIGGGGGGGGVPNPIAPNSVLVGTDDGAESRWSDQITIDEIDGSISITGAASADGNGGADVNITGGADNTDEGGAGRVVITGGAAVVGGGGAGPVRVVGGAGVDDLDGESVGIAGGDGVGGQGGPVYIDGGGSATEKGGDVALTGGASSGSENGGDVTLQGGGSAGGERGNIKLLSVPTADPAVANALYKEAGLIASSGGSPGAGTFTLKSIEGVMTWVEDIV